MEFYSNQLFHIYNKGNNSRQLFFSDENYKYFLWKMRGHLLPFGELICWCLMPNHYHWLFFVKNVYINRIEYRKYVDDVEYQRRIAKYGKNAQYPDREQFRKSSKENISLNDAIGILQSSYSAAVNKANKWTGSLFEKELIAKDGWIDEFVTLKKNGKENFLFRQGNDFGFHCLNYIHQNPEVAKIVNKATDYPWSSAQDYAGLRKGTLCNVKLGQEILNFI